MKSGVIPALSNNTRAHTLPEWEEKRFNSSLGMSGLAVLAAKRRKIIQSATFASSHFEKAGKHLVRNGASLSGNVLFFFSCKENPRAHICPIGQVSWWLEIAKLIKLVDRIDIFTYCCGAVVIVQC